MRVLCSAFMAAVFGTVIPTSCGDLGSPFRPHTFSTILKTRESGTSIQRVDMSGQVLPSGCKPPHVGEDFSAFATIIENTGIENTGHERVVLDYGGDEKRYYASLAKMMTLLLVLEDVEAKKVSLDDRLPVTLDARDRNGTHFFRMFNYQDNTISLDDALMIIGNRSTNDVARVIGEALAESADSWGEIQYADRMTERAWALGMRHTRFIDASGFKSERAYRSTAHDMTVLKRALHDKFPDADRRYLATPAFTVMDGRKPINLLNTWPEIFKKSLPDTWHVVSFKVGAYAEQGDKVRGYNMALTLQDQRQPDRIAHMVVMGGTSSQGTLMCTRDLMGLALP